MRNEEKVTEYTERVPMHLSSWINQSEWGSLSESDGSEEEEEEEEEEERCGSGGGKQKKAERRRRRRRNCWKGKQKRRRSTWSLLSLSGLHAMYWHAFADIFATATTSGLLNTISLSLSPTKLFLPVDRIVQIETTKVSHVTSDSLCDIGVFPNLIRCRVGCAHLD